MKKMNKKGFTLVEIMIVVAIIGLLAAIGIPSFQKARASSQQKACINNLRIIDGAKEQSAMENGITDLAAPETGELDEYIKGTTAALTCPQATTRTFAGSYSINAVGAAAECDVDDTHAL